MGRKRRRGRRSGEFRSWGLLLSALAVLSGLVRQWTTCAVWIGILVVYFGALRLTRCRVETTKHLPCRWLVRGTIGTCKYHVGYKRGLPRLVRGSGFTGLPTFMWPRDHFDGAVSARAEPQPGSGRAVTVKAARPGYERLTVALTVGGFVVAVVGVVRDFVAG
ncbi:hypothetical protein GCM10009742_81080 [Kribbella karoonensis]|uniref:PH (Pleckstrin Homology) domain-containing protein n=1 Tax=Kribbella karoonensis TaxID=324851 RepID=A0ABN2ETB1_9ACTN